MYSLFEPFNTPVVFCPKKLRNALNAKCAKNRCVFTRYKNELTPRVSGPLFTIKARGSASFLERNGANVYQVPYLQVRPVGAQVFKSGMEQTCSRSPIYN